VAHGEFAQHLVEQIVEVPAADHGVEKRRVPLLGPGQVEAVVLRAVEEVPLAPPDLAVHLAPFHRRVHPDLHPIQVQPALAGLARHHRRQDGPARPLPHQRLFAVGGESEERHAVEGLLLLALLQVEAVNGGGAGAWLVRIEGRRFHQEQGAGLAGNQAHVVAGRHGQSHDSQGDPLEIDLHLRRLRARFAWRGGGFGRFDRLLRRLVGAGGLGVVSGR